MVAEYPSRSKNACFQGQRSAHAVQWCTDYYSGAVSGPTLSPGSLGSAQAFQNPAGVLSCSAVIVTQGQSLLKKRDKTPRSQPRVGSKRCTSVEFIAQRPQQECWYTQNCSKTKILWTSIFMRTPEFERERSPGTRLSCTWAKLGLLTHVGGEVRA